MAILPSSCSSCGGGGGGEACGCYPEDSAHVSGSQGTLVLGVRNDAGGSLVDANGDYAPLQFTSTGELRVTTAAAGALVGRDDTDNQAPVATGLQTVVNRMYAFDGTNWDRVRSGPTAGSVLVDQGTSPWVVSGTVVANQGTSPWVVSGTVTADTELPAASALADADPNPTTSRIGANSLVYNGATWDRVRSGTALGSVLVNNPTAANLLATVNQGTSPWVVSGTVAVTQATSPWVISGTVTADTELPAASALADADPNPTTSRIGANNLVYNGTTWDRARSGTALGSVLVNNPTAANLLATVNQGTSPWVVSGTVAVTQATSPWVVSGTVTADTELPAATVLADEDPNPTTSRIGANNLVYNGATWDRVRSGPTLGSILVNNPTPANLLATVTTEYQFAEDSVHASGAMGAFVLAVRNDAGTSLVSANGDYAPLQVDSSGALRISGSLSVGGTAQDDTDDQVAVVTGAGLRVVRNYLWDPVESNWDRARSRGDDADGQSTTTEGAAVVAGRNFVFSTATGWNRAREAHADALATGIPGSGNMIFNGSNWDRRRSGGVTGSTMVAGAAAHDAAVGGNPVLIGAAAVGDASSITPVANGDVSQLKTDLQGVLRVKESRPRLRGIYYSGSGPHQLALAADAATAGRLWLVNTSGTVAVAVRRIVFTSVSGTALVSLTFPRINVERMTFTGTPSGAAITPCLRDSTDAVNTGTLRTASTGMTITAGAAAKNFCPNTVLTAVGVSMPSEQVFDLTDHDDERIVLRQNQGIVIRQADAGTTADTRRFFVDIQWEEYDL